MGNRGNPNRTSDRFGRGRGELNMELHIRTNHYFFGDVTYQID